MSERFNNELTEAQTERLAVLLEELGEAEQAIGKILRHGYRTINPHGLNQSFTNRNALERELGDVLCAIDMITSSSDVSRVEVGRRTLHKQESIKRWLHHQSSGAVAEGQQSSELVEKTPSASPGERE